MDGRDQLPWPRHISTEPANDKLTYAILGTGALGGFYGIKLAYAGKDVHFLLHSDYEHVLRHRLFMESIDGDIRLPSVNAYCQVEDMPQCDVVCVCLKTTKNHLLPQMLPPAVKPGGAVMVMQNGIGIEQEIAGLVPNAHVLGAMCYLCSNKVGPGHIKHLDYGQIDIGAYGSPPAGLLEKIRDDFESAGVPAQIEQDIHTARWKKLVWNIPFNGLAVVLNITTDRIMADSDTRSLVEALMTEVVTAAQVCGCHVNMDYVAQMMEFTDNMKPYLPSMKLDFDAKRPLEVKYLYEMPLDLVKRHGFHMPKVQMLCQQLKFLDACNASNSNGYNGSLITDY